MKKYLFTAILSAFFVFLVGAFETSAQTVTGSIGTVKRGGSVKGTVVLDIPGGLHVNSNRPNSQYAIPTTVRLTVVGAKVGGVSYPRGRNRKFSFSEDTINVYEGRAVFGFNLSVPQSFKGNTVRIRAVVRYQACNDEVCFPPKTKEITLTARVQ